MKYFITLAVACLVASVLATPAELNEEQKAKAKEFFEECLKAENVSEEDATKLRNKEYDSPTDNMKCFGTCFFEKVGVMKDGAVQEDVVLEKMGPQYGEDKIKTVLDKCKDVKGVDRCDSGYQVFQCFQKAKAELAN